MGQWIHAMLDGDGNVLQAREPAETPVSYTLDAADGTTFTRVIAGRDEDGIVHQLHDLTTGEVQENRPTKDEPSTFTVASDAGEDRTFKFWYREDVEGDA